MRILKFFLALLLLPVLYFVLVQTGIVLLHVFSHLRMVISFASGAAVYALIHYKWYDFSRMYVFMHEMTHALAALCCGSRIRGMRVGKDSGYVKMDKTNTFIVLAPYFVPGYVLFVAAVYIMAGLFVDMAPWRQVFLFLIGFFTAFHFIQTFKTLWEADQPDLKLAGGKTFSIITITLVNLLVLVGVLKGLFPEEVSLRVTGENIVKNTVQGGVF